MRRALAAGVLAATWFFLGAAPAHAQLCHDLPSLESHHQHAGKHAAKGEKGAHDGHDGHGGHGAHDSHDSDGEANGSQQAGHGVGLSLGLRVEAATAAIQRRPIDYQGTSLRVDLHLRRFHFRAQASWYRLRDSIESTTGPGDVMVAAMWTAYQSERLHAGVALPVGLPTGDDEERLGMGHVMIMPGLFAALQASATVTTSLGVAYNRALGSSHGHSHGIGPYVNPMTREELGVAGRVAKRVASPLYVVAEAALAAPFDGDPRMIVGGGFTLQKRRISLSVLAQAGALETPFTGRGVVDLSYAF